MNLILSTDSYKLTHWRMYPQAAAYIHSYLEPRTGNGYQKVVWCGLQGVLKDYFSTPISLLDVEEAEDVAKSHFGPAVHLAPWETLVRKHNGRLPVRIKALPEGTVVDRGTPVMTIENTDPEFPWLTNVLETLLMHVWYPSTVATVSRDLRKTFQQYTDAPVDFMLHDFGYRGVSSHESAGRGGFGHLLSFKGTDTLAAIQYIRKHYGQYDNIAYSVPASEHSVMTMYGQDGEADLIRRLIWSHNRCILSLVADSYDVYEFARKLKDHTTLALNHDVKLVIRPDSVTPQHPEPVDLILWLLNFLPPEINVLWGDGLTPDQITNIVRTVYKSDPANVNRLVFGMGGGLLQKVNRDTLRWAMKCSAVGDVEGNWRAVQKSPLDQSKASKPGKQDGGMETIFENGLLLKQYTFNEIRERAQV